MSTGLASPTGSVEAVRGIDWCLSQGEVFALLWRQPRGTDDNGGDTGRAPGKDH